MLETFFWQNIFSLEKAISFPNPPLFIKFFLKQTNKVWVQKFCWGNLRTLNLCKVKKFGKTYKICAHIYKTAWWETAQAFSNKLRRKTSIFELQISTLASLAILNFIFGYGGKFHGEIFIAWAFATCRTIDGRFRFFPPVTLTIKCIVSYLVFIVFSHSRLIIQVK